GLYDDVLGIVTKPLPSSLTHSDLAVQKDVLEGAANVHLHHFPEAEQKLAAADARCLALKNSVCNELLTVRGSLEIERGEYQRALPFYETSLRSSREQGDRFSEAAALLNLSHIAVLEEHYDEAIDRSEEAYRAAQAIGAQRIMLTAQGNLGWAYYMIGDAENALTLFLQAEQRSRQLGSIVDEIRWLTTSGYVHLDRNNWSLAQDHYLRSLDLARQINSREQVLDSITSLAFVTLQTRHLDEARRYSDEAIALAHADGNRVDELYPLLVRGQANAYSGSPRLAEQIFLEIANDPKVDLSLKWEAQHELANLYVAEHQLTQALSAYRTTIKTFETARSEIQHEVARLPFLSNATSLYDDYVSFLLVNGKVAEALSVADHARARTLAEGLGQLSKTDPTLPSPIDAQDVARRAGGTILYYFLGAKQSYLWAVTAQKTAIFRLPQESQIDAVVRRYRKALETPKDPLASQNTDGVELYRMLVGPAASLIRTSRRVFVIPDGSLNALNFEALVAPDPEPHYWIEDVTIANASSLRLLEHSQSNSRAQKRTLLLVGNPLAAGVEYGTLPQAASEMASVGQRFATAERHVLAQAEATPAAYLDSNPARYSYIHFVAHGTASRLSPLDSAIVLSRSSSENDSFKLYARDIIHRPLRAELVTISSCYGAGARSYSGEGLVGLSWAFLRAGAHNVIGALWDVSDASTPQLMDRMYAAIQSGKAPAEALRAAKLSLLHSQDSFSRPFYWAPFQLYTGS
ncbi:MAG TPA: CHAT domain-containing tetratricopeptide repeat protein, partial [Terriglobales bacterium]|nr:CHAT domain-containing tetratricopeptide repeat protein [Terriglobales bacterium]